MKLIVLLLSALAASASVAEEKSLPPGHPPVSGQQLNAPAASPADLQKASVLEVIQVPQYTYLEVKQGEQSLWLAAPSVEVKKGDTVRFQKGLVMKAFHSNSLNRTFENILFVNRVEVGAD